MTVAAVGHANPDAIDEAHKGGTYRAIRIENGKWEMYVNGAFVDTLNNAVEVRQFIRLREQGGTPCPSL